MTLQLKKPFSRLTPFVYLVRSVLQLVRQTVRSHPRRLLTAASVPLKRAVPAAPPIEVPAVRVPLEAEPPLEPPSNPLELPTPVFHSPEPVAPFPTPELQQPIDRPAEGGSAERPAEGGSAERSRQVVALLDEADRLGLTTYPQLMDYVKAKTGTGCSRRTIANWKRARQLSE